MAHTKNVKATKGNRDSIAKRLGVKIYGGAPAKNGNIIIRQRGMSVGAGVGVRMGHDFTLYAVSDGIVNFKQRKGKKLVEVVQG